MVSVVSCFLGTISPEINPLKHSISCFRNTQSTFHADAALIWSFKQVWSLQWSSNTTRHGFVAEVMPQLSSPKRRGQDFLLTRGGCFPPASASPWETQEECKSLRMTVVGQHNVATSVLTWLRRKQKTQETEKNGFVRISLRVDQTKWSSLLILEATSSSAIGSLHVSLLRSENPFSPSRSRRALKSTGKVQWCCYVAMDQYLLVPFLGEWTSIYQLFWCSPRVQGFDTLPCVADVCCFFFSAEHRVPKKIFHVARPHETWRTWPSWPLSCCRWALGAGHQGAATGRLAAGHQGRGLNGLGKWTENPWKPLYFMGKTHGFRWSFFL